MTAKTDAQRKADERDRPDNATVWRHELQAWAQVSGETMRVWIRNGRLPKPSIVISRNRQGWAAGELRRHGVEVT